MDKLREMPGVVKTGLLAFWLVHGSWGFVVSLPVTLANGVDFAASPPSLNWVDYAGAAIWAVGMVMEAAADRAKLAAYHSVPRTPYHKLGRLWAWSRHPNFAGETL